MSNTVITTRAPGKIILLGEYAVLEGAPALVTAVNRYCEARLTAQTGPVFEFIADNFDLPSFRFKMNDKGVFQLLENDIFRPEKLPSFLLSVLNYVVKYWGKTIPGISCRINTSGFYHSATGDKFGIGSSAAVTVALLNALNKLINDDTEEKNIFSDALQAHRNGQKSGGSGIDIAASVYETSLRYQIDADTKRNPRIQALQWPQNLHMLVIWTGRSTSTRSMINKVDLFKEKEPAAYDAILKEMYKVAEDGADAFQSNNTEGFMELVPQFTDLEMKLGKSSGTNILSKEHQYLFELIQKNGGVYKPSGAGGGDIGIAFSNRESTIEKLKNVIINSSFEVLDLSVAQKGITKIKTHGTYRS